MEIKLLRLGEVENIVAMKKTKIYRLISQGKFPSPLKNVGQSVWSSIDIEKWIDQLLQNK